MKRILVASSIAALALVGSAGAAQAAPADAACFGQLHNAINNDGALAPTFNSVAELVAAAGGQGKKAAARAACA